MFRKNDIQQISIGDTFNKLTEREQKRMEKSWAKYFGDEIFELINEEIFRGIYSDNEKSRPNTPVNICVALSIIKEMFDLTDEEIVENVLFDIRYQYAIHTTSYEEQPVNNKTLYRFRKRVIEYNEKNNTDIYYDCMTGLAEKIRILMGLTPNIRRMDSMMISSNIKRLSRFELIYRCISNLVKYLHKNGYDDIIEGMEHYYDDNDFNQVTYHNKSSSMEEKTQTLLKDAGILLEKCGKQFENIREYQLFFRCLTEQTITENNERRLKTKEDKSMNSQMLQNPSDPDATYRSKNGKESIGYAANFEETVDSSGAVITDYQVEQNTYSDSQFMEDRLNRLEDKQENTENETSGEREKTTIVTDGAYASEDNDKLAEEKNVEIVTTNLTGKETPDIMGDFEINEEGDEITKCPCGNTPVKCTSNPKYGTITAKFEKGCCENCPHREECHAKVNKSGSARVTVSKGSVKRALKQREMKKKSYNLYYRLRNGAETIMSIMRRKYRIDKIPAVGKSKVRFFVGSKVGAYNVTKLFHFRRGQLCCARNLIFE